MYTFKTLNKIKVKEIVYLFAYQISFEQPLFASTALVCGLTVALCNQETRWWVISLKLGLKMI